MPSIDTSKTGRAYWRSLDDLADTPEFREMMSREFVDYSPDQVITSPTRRGFMKLMGASMALAGAGGVAGCRRWPETKVLPYAERPGGRVPGVPEQFATVMEFGGVARPLLINSFDGRPTKVEGNPTHPQSGGATDAFSQASVLAMYDPDRSRHVLREGQRSSWRAFAAGLDALGLRENGGAGFAVLSEATSSPSVAAMRDRIAGPMPDAQWFEYEPINRDNEIEGARLAFGEVVRPHLKLDGAKVIVTLDADILGTHPASLKYARDWATGRRPSSEGGMNRLWSIDSRFTVTSSNADRRLPMRSSRISGVVRALAAEVGVEGRFADSSEGLDEKAAAFVRDLAADLSSHAGRSVLVAGPSQPPEVHAAVWLINEQLGNLGQTVVLTEEPAGDAPSQVQQIEQLVSAMNAGEVRTLLILGGNPVYDAPADLRFAEALSKVNSSIHLSEYEDETSAACTVHLPRSHYLESWGDARSWDGTISVQQPLIYPLYQTRSTIEVLAMIAGDDLEEGLEIVRRTARQYLPGGASEKSWRKTLRDGLVEGSGFEEVTPQVNSDAAGRIAEAVGSGSESDLELVFTEDYSVYDGRFATNGWMQELPDPLTKITWDNAALISPATAERLGVGQNDLVRLSIGEGENRRSMDAAVFLMPGQADGSISVALGYGRSNAGYIGTGVGFDAYQVRTTGMMHVLRGVELAKLGTKYELVTTQDHHAIDKLGMEEREDRVFGNIVRSATLEHYREHPDFAEHLGPHVVSMESTEGALPLKGEEGVRVPLQVWDEPLEWNEGHQWGMSIDMNACTGCSACVIACQAENNVPIVGKDEVARGREMHWIRIDRYFGGDREDPEAVHQPMLCQHCENAPCESVCPVAATVHDSEGLNVMIYNRCIGVRYCSNNCPYKVRRFNWFDWHAKPVKGGPHTATYLGPPDQQQKTIDPIRQMQFNPEVTVRMRGVMEKCTFCVQRIKAATIPARNEFAREERNTDRVADGAITPACAQSCPTEAITFGNLGDPSSRVAERFQEDRAYEVLKELNVRNRIRYLARITNPGDEGEHGEAPGAPDSHREEHG